MSFNTDYTVEYGENVNVGFGSVTVKSKAGSNYIFINAVKNFNIVAKAGQLTISGNLEVTYGTAVPDVVVHRNGSDGAVTIYCYTDEECTTGKMTTKPTNAGEYWVKAEMAASANYSNAESNVLGFAISRANINPAVNIVGWTYKDTANTPSVSGNTENGTVTYKYKAKTADDSAYSVSVPTSAGEYTVKAEIAQINNYNAGSATQNFTISGEANGCTIDNGILTSGASNGTVKITVSISAKDVNGGNINEYNAFTGIDAIAVTINDKATQTPLQCMTISSRPGFNKKMLKLFYSLYSL